ncbi:MAG: ATP-binding protein, partial [Acidobacteriota bacterium]
HFFDLESPRDLARLQEPELALERLQGLVVLDEVQRYPRIFEILRVLIDRPDLDLQFLILGSASPDLLRQSSESLAGRVAFYELEPFALDELGLEAFENLWIRGGFPRSVLAPTEMASFDWRRNFIRTFLERDLPALGVRIPGETLRRFWIMAAHAHGSVWNSSRFAASFGVSGQTVKRYLDLLSAALVIRQLPPWFENLAKRQVRSPKVYLADSGLLHALLDLPSFVDLEAHPQLGASFEGFIIEQIKIRIGARRDQCYFWATHAGAELDLLIASGHRRWGFEIKRTVSPRVTKSLRASMASLKLDRTFLIHGGADSYPLAHGVEAVAASRLWLDLPRLAD